MIEKERLHFYQNRIEETQKEIEELRAKIKNEVLKAFLSLCYQYLYYQPDTTPLEQTIEKFVKRIGVMGNEFRNLVKDFRYSLEFIRALETLNFLRDREERVRERKKSLSLKP